jgi:hypothetical protein
MCAAGGVNGFRRFDAVTSGFPARSSRLLLIQNSTSSWIVLDQIGYAACIDATPK